MQALERWAVESNFWLGQVGESGELRVRRYVAKLPPSATVRVILAEAAQKMRALCASGLIKLVGDPFAEAGRLCDPVGGVAGFWSCAQFCNSQQDTHSVGR